MKKVIKKNTTYYPYYFLAINCIAYCIFLYLWVLPAW